MITIKTVRTAHCSLCNHVWELKDSETTDTCISCGAKNSLTKDEQARYDAFKNSNFIDFPIKDISIILGTGIIFTIDTPDICHELWKLSKTTGLLGKLIKDNGKIYEVRDVEFAGNKGKLGSQLGLVVIAKEEIEETKEEDTILF